MLDKARSFVGALVALAIIITPLGPGLAAVVEMPHPERQFDRIGAKQARDQVWEKAREEAQQKARRSAEARQEEYRSRVAPLLRRLHLQPDEAKRRIALYNKLRPLLRYSRDPSAFKDFDVTEGVVGGTIQRNATAPLGLARPYGFIAKSEPNRPNGATKLLGPLIPSTTLIVNAVPHNRQGFKNVFGEKAVASASALAQVSATNQSLREIKAQHYDATDLTGLKQQLAKTDAGVVLFIGHNENGVLTTPSGAHIPIVELASLCAEQGRLCVHLSCSAGKYIKDVGGIGPSADITAVQAARIALKIVTILEAEPRTHPLAAGDSRVSVVYVDPWSMAGKVDDAIAHDVNRRARMHYVGVIIGGVVIIALVVIILDDEDKRRRQLTR